VLNDINKHNSSNKMGCIMQAIHAIQSI